MSLEDYSEDVSPKRPKIDKIKKGPKAKIQKETQYEESQQY